MTSDNKEAILFFPELAEEYRHVVHGGRDILELLLGEVSSWADDDLLMGNPFNYPFPAALLISATTFRRRNGTGWSVSLRFLVLKGAIKDFIALLEWDIDDPIPMRSQVEVP